MLNYVYHARAGMCKGVKWLAGARSKGPKLHTYAMNACVRPCVRASLCPCERACVARTSTKMHNTSVSISSPISILNVTMFYMFCAPYSLTNTNCLVFNYHNSLSNSVINKIKNIIQTGFRWD